MLIKGDRIKLVKAMGCFDNIGEICDVVSISEDAVIGFKFGGIHLGCMSYNEFEKYFEKVENTKQDWTEWEEKKVGYYDIDNDYVYATIEYRHNGVKVQTRGYGLKGRSSCNKVDNFDLYKGLKIATARLLIKILNSEVEELAKSM
jgi:hypothetical protein